MTATQPVNPTKNLPPLKAGKPKVDNIYQKWILYGDPGVGKTSLAASSNGHEAMRDTLLIPVEKGTLSLTGETVLGFTPPDVLAFDKDEDTGESRGLGWLENVLYHQLAMGGHNYKTLIFDTYDVLYKFALEEVVKKACRKNSKHPPDEVWWDDYGEANSWLIRIADKFLSLPMHVIFITHRRERKEEDGTEKIVPNLTPGLGAYLMGQVDVMGYLTTKKQKQEGTTFPKIVRQLITEPVGKIEAKDRTPGGKLGRMNEDPTMPMLMDKILGK